MHGARLRNFAERYTRAWCSHDPQAVAAFFAPNGALTINDGDAAKGREAVAAEAQGFMAAFPDLTIEMDEVRDGDEASYHWTLIGTNSGPGGTGRRVRISGREDWRFGEDGLIADSRGHFDATEYRRQIEHGTLAAEKEA
jgi:uncharacterized protein (TIGR02246 family)